MAFEQQLPSNVNDELASTIVEPVDELVEDTSDFETVGIVDQEIEAESDDLNEISESLEAYSVLLKQAGENGISHQSAAMMRVGVESIDRKLGFDKPGFGMEDFRTCTPRDGRRQVIISVEDLKERVKEVGKKFLELLKRIWEYAKNIWNKLTGPAKSNEQKATYLLTCIPKFPGYPGGQFKGELPQPPATVKTNLPAIVEKEIEARKEATDEEKPSTVRISNANLLVRIVKSNPIPDVSVVKEQAALQFLHGEYADTVNKFSRDLLSLVKKYQTSKNYDGLPEKIEKLYTDASMAAYRAEYDFAGGAFMGMDREKHTGWKFTEDGEKFTGEFEFEIRPLPKLHKFLESARTTSANFIGKNYYSQTEEARKNFQEVMEITNEMSDNHLGDNVDRAAYKAIRQIEAAQVIASCESYILRLISAKIALAEAELAGY